MAKVRELRDLGEEDLIERLDSSKEELFNLRFQLATGQLDNPMRIKELRHDVARILTILRERDLERELEELDADATSPVEVEGSSSEAVAPGGDSAKRRRRRQEEDS